nr:hypothetical protein [Limosilactobacillus mucosae]
MKLNKMSKACIVAVMVAVFAVVPLVQLNAGQNANYVSASSKKVVKHYWGAGWQWFHGI